MTQLPKEFCAAHRMIVIAETEASITIGVSPSADAVSRYRAARALRQMSPAKTVDFVELTEPDLMIAVAGIDDGNATKEPNRRRKDHHDADISTIENDAPIITVLNGILLDAHERSASDIHIETSRESTAIRFRIDGVLKAIRTIDAETGQALSSRVKLLANLNTLEMRKPQDGRFRIATGTGMSDMRVSSVPGIHGESVVLRFLDNRNSSGELETLGFQDSAYARLAKLASIPDGLILVTGPTGCGKTTTLAALIKRCGPESKKIVTIEDPVEFLIPGITQIQTNESIGLGFSALLRRILRQDPDVIVVGEIRDAETAELAVRAALTGHLVLSTLHTPSAADARIRLIDMGVPDYIIAGTLKAVIGQRLLRKSVAKEGEIAYSGRIPVTEILTGANLAEQSGRNTLRDEALALVARGLTTMAEVDRVFGKPEGEAA